MPKERVNTKEEFQEQEDLREVEVPRSELADFLDDKRADVQAAIGDRSQWSLELSKWYRWRKGVEGAKPDANKPWKNSSNIHYRRSEKAIREHKSAAVNSVMQSQRLTRFIHASPSADKMETYFEFKLRCEMDWASICTAEQDVLLEKGLVITKQTWRVETEPYTVTCERQRFEDALLQVAVQAATNPMTGAVDFAKFGKTKNKMEGVNKLVPKEQQQEIVASIAGYPPVEDDDEDGASVYARRVASILKQLNDGEDCIEYIDDREVYNGFDIAVIRDPNMVIWGPRKAIDIQQAEWVCHRLRYSEREMLNKSKKNGGPWKNVEAVLDALSGKDDGSKHTSAGEYPEETYQETSKNLYEGVVTPPAQRDMVNVWELSCYVPRKWIRRMNKLSLEDGDTYVRAVITFCPDVTGEISVLRVIEHPYEFKLSKDRWNYCSHTHNKGAGDLYSGEGIPKLMNPYEASFNIAKNLLSDRNTVCVNPWILTRDDIGINESQLRTFPSIIKVNQPNGTLEDAVKVVQFPNLGFFQAETDSYAQAGDEIVGSANLAALNNYAEPPTAQQVEALSAPAGAVAQFELLGYHNFKAKQYRQLYDLLWQFKGENMDEQHPEVVSVPDKKGEVVSLTPDDFKDDYAILSGTDVLRDNPVLAAQKRLAGAQLLLSDPRLAPYYNMAELVNMIITDHFGYLGATRVGVSMDEAQRMQAQMDNIKQAAMQQAAQEGDQLTKTAKKKKQLANAMPINSGPMQQGGAPMGGMPQGMFTGGMR